MTTMMGAHEPVVDPWMHAMRHGDWGAAWKVSDAVLASRRGQPCWHWPRHLQYIWDGTPLAGRRVLIRCYHGLGDTVQFIRYAPLVRRIAREVVVWAQPELLPFLRTAPEIGELRPLHEGRPDVDYDVDVELMELPHVFRTTVATVPEGRIFPAARASPPGEWLDVGLVWHAGAKDDGRSIPLRLIEPLLAMPMVRWHVLQRGPAVSEWRGDRRALVGSDRVEVAAGLMGDLDLVITIDSFPAHLSGVLGMPTWTLLQHHADWRWMADRDDSPWYPTMRLFRQARPGDWAAVVDRVRAGLAQLSGLKRVPAARTHMHAAGFGVTKVQK